MKYLVNFLYRQRRKNKLLEDVYAFINSNKDRNVFVKVYINEHSGKKVDLLEMAWMRHSDTVSQHSLASDVSRRITSPRDHAPPISEA